MSSEEATPATQSIVPEGAALTATEEPAKNAEGESNSGVSKNLQASDLVAESISLLARTGNGLSYAYTKLEFHGKTVPDLDVLESFPHLRYVDVSENTLTNINGLAHLEYVLSLDVHGNYLTSVPAAIDRRKYLQHANFAKNRISSWNVSRWPMLSWLNLNGNVFVSV